MVGVHLLGSRPTVGALKHLLQKVYRLARLDVVARLLSRILNCIVLSAGMYLLLQRNYSAG
jgi:hypothetical protein